METMASFAAKRRRDDERPSMSDKKCKAAISNPYQAARHDIAS
jgi:hypothetical protein